jgi:hypothetical protein
MPSTLKGKFRPKNPEKYKGDPTNIIFRSSWERDVMHRLDMNSKVVSWSSEERCIWYNDPVTKKPRRYFPDFIVTYDRDGIMVTEMIEVKPQRHIDGPNPKPKRRTKSWMNEVRTYVTNTAKWKAAEEYCEDRGWNWKLLSEQQVPSWRK